MAAVTMNPPASSRLRDWMVLTKFKISVASTLTAGMGYIAVAHGLRVGILPALLGVLFLAMAGCALNEVAERDIDALMERTRHRPIPGGTVSARTVTVVGLGLATVGTVVLALGSGVAAALLGVLALFWYNALYTPMKRYSAFAVVPGAVIGALPPAIGWAAAGGNIEDPALLALGFFFFMWQVPHFWLLALRHQHDYERGGLPTLAKYFTLTQIYRLIFTWTAASVAACGLLWFFQAVGSPTVMVAIAVAGVALLVRFRFMLRYSVDTANVRTAFMDINGFALVVIVGVALDALIVP